MRVASPFARVAAGTLAGAITSLVIVALIGLRPHHVPGHRLVPEDASGALRRIAIHYAPAADARALPVWRQLFRVLPGDVEVAVAVERPADFTRFVARMRGAGVGALDRFRPVVVGHPITTWSRDRMASLADDAVLAPPRTAAGTGPRAGDWAAPFALSRALYRREPVISSFVFEGGDLAASRGYLFADVNLIGRNLGRGDATRRHLEAALRARFDQDVVWLGELPGDVPEHHIMMYVVPLDDHRVVVGDVRLGRALAPDVPADPDLARHAARFDRVAGELAARGFVVTRIPVVVLPGAGSYVTYTNAVFDRDAAGPVVYLPTYRIPALDAAAARTYGALGFRVVPIDVSTIYRQNGSLGCLVNVMARDGA